MALPKLKEFSHLEENELTYTWQLSTYTKQIQHNKFQVD